MPLATEGFMKFRAALFPVTLWALAIGPAHGQGTDDHGNHPGAATFIEVDAPVAGRQDGPVDADYFVFEATAGTTYRFLDITEGAPAGAPDVKQFLPEVPVVFSLLEPDGETAIFNYPNDWICPVTGLYFLAYADPENLRGRADYVFVVETLGEGLTPLGSDPLLEGTWAAVLANPGTVEAAALEIHDGQLDVLIFGLREVSRFSGPLEAFAGDPLRRGQTSLGFVSGSPLLNRYRGLALSSFSVYSVNERYLRLCTSSALAALPAGAPAPLERHCDPERQLDFVRVPDFALPYFDAAPQVVDFGAVTVGETAARTVRVQNVSRAVLRAAVSAPLPFSVAPGSSVDLRPNRAAYITVNFTPEAEGEIEAPLSLVGANGAIILLRGAGMEGGAHVEGTVRLPGGGPAVGAAVAVGGDDSQRWTLTGPDGSYRIGPVSSGLQPVAVHLNGFALAASTLSLTPGDVRTADIEMTAATSPPDLEGLVWDAVDQLGIGGARVRLIADGFPLMAGFTSGRGSFAIALPEELPAQAVARVQIEADGYLPVTVDAADLSPEEAIALEPDRRAGRLGAIEVQVLRDGRGASGIPVTLRFGTAQRRAESDTRGMVEFRGLAPGVYEVVAIDGSAVLGSAEVQVLGEAAPHVVSFTVGVPPAGLGCGMRPAAAGAGFSGVELLAPLTLLLAAAFWAIFRAIRRIYSESS